jgi:hypothetical protein
MKPEPWLSHPKKHVIIVKNKINLFITKNYNLNSYEKLSIAIHNICKNMKKLIIIVTLFTQCMLSCLNIDDYSSSKHETSNDELKNVYVTINECKYEEKIFSFYNGNEIIIKEKDENSQYSNTNNFIEWLQKNNLSNTVVDKQTTIDQWGTLLTKIEFKKNTKIKASYL